MYSIKYPVAFHPVDMAITRIHEGRIQVLLAQKVKDTDNKVWRFPGGFVDPWDCCAEEAALRESIEETEMKFGSTEIRTLFDEYFSKKQPLTSQVTKLIEEFADEKEITSLINKLHEIKIPEKCLAWLRSRVNYIGSTKIDDARYRDTDHKVITSFYELHPVSGEAGEGPFDDIARTKWFGLSEIKSEIMHPSHVPLFEMLFEKYKADKMIENMNEIIKDFKNGAEEIFGGLEKKVLSTMEKVNNGIEKLFKDLD